jgi:hypothetical protein
MACEAEDEKEAAAPATTTASAKIRIASFIIDYPFADSVDREERLPLTLKW